MTLSGWIFMLSSLGAVTVLAGWCFSRVLSQDAGARDDTDEEVEG